MKDLIEIAALAIIGIFIYMVVYSYVINYKKRKGKLSPRVLIEMTSGEMFSELKMRGYKHWGLGSLETLKSLDDFIEKKKETYDAESMLKDNDLVLRCGSLAGEIYRMKKHLKWEFENDQIPVLKKKDKSVYPYEIIKKKISGQIESLYDYFTELDF